MINTKSRIFRFIVGLDQALNPLVYGGSEDVTLSAQSAYNELVLHKDHRKRKFIDWLFRKMGQVDHCYHSLISEIDEFQDADLIRVILAEKGINEEG